MELQEAQRFYEQRNLKQLAAELLYFLRFPALTFKDPPRNMRAATPATGPLPPIFLFEMMGW